MLRKPLKKDKLYTVWKTKWIKKSGKKDWFCKNFCLTKKVFMNIIEMMF